MPLWISVYSTSLIKLGLDWNFSLEQMRLTLKQISSTFLILIFLLIHLACPDPPDDLTESNPYKQEHIEWPSLADSPWPTFRHDYQGTGRFEGVGPASNNYEILYEADAGYNYGSVSVGNYNNVLFSADCKLICIDVEGNLIWESDMCEHLSGNYAESYLAPIITSDSTVIIASWDQYLYCFNENTGEKLWEFKIGHKVDYTPLIGLDGSIYFSSDSGTCALYNDGTLKWHFDDVIIPLAFSPDGNQIYGRRGIESSIIAMDLNGNVVWENELFRTPYFIVDNDGNIYGSNPLSKKLISLDENGNINWNISIIDISTESEIIGIEYVSPILDVYGRINYIMSDSQSKSHLVRINVNGEIEQDIKLNIREISTSLVSDNNGSTYIYSFFGGDPKDKVIAIDKDGEILMEVINGDYGYYGSPAFTKEGYLIFLPNWYEMPLKVRIYK